VGTRKTRNVFVHINMEIQMRKIVRLSLLIGLFFSFISNVSGSEECHATYSLDGSVHIPHVYVDVSGAAYYRVGMEPLDLYALTFKVTNVELLADEPIYQWLYQQQDNNTGLLGSQEDDYVSTYNNALAVMVFTLKNNFQKAERILFYFNSKFNDTEFYINGEPRGFYQYRNSKTGQPHTNSNRWMGDNAWLLMAIHHYKASTGSTTYDAMAEGIADLLESFQQSDGYIASGWENGDEKFNTSSHTEGNLDAYKAMLLQGRKKVAERIRNWLDFNDLDWKSGPLDLCSWRVLSLGAEYGFCLSEKEHFSNQYKRSISYNSQEVTGFVPFTPLSNNIWTEGTGQMAVSFYKAGYEQLGDMYAKELEKLLIDSVSFPNTKTLAYLALPDPKEYSWVDTSKGHVAGVTWYIFAKNRFDPFDGKTINSPPIQNPVHRIQAENYNTSGGGIRADNRGLLDEGKAIHIAGDNDSSCVNDDCSGWAEYRFNTLVSLTNASISMRYAEDMVGDHCSIFLDGNLVKLYTPEYTGTDDISGWDNYVWSESFPVEFIIEPGLHTLRIEGKDNRTNGFSIDRFHIEQSKGSE
jgi:hypothetical protein